MVCCVLVGIGLGYWSFVLVYVICSGKVLIFV